jgi:hypothetical protein
MELTVQNTLVVVVVVQAQDLDFLLQQVVLGDQV